jgi:PII-like signaling protein
MNEDCLKLTAYFDERLRIPGRFVADAMLDLYGRHNVATSVMLRGIGGFGGRHQLRTDESLSLSEEPPVAVVGVDTRTKIESLAGSVVEMTPRGLVTLERARLVDEENVGVDDNLDDAIKLTVYVGRQERVFGVPAYYAVCDLLHRRGLAGAAVFLGVDGTSHGERARASFFSRNVNVPMMIIAVGERSPISRVLPELGGLLRRPLLTVERVRVCKSDGELLARPDPLPGADEQGRPLWQKLMVYTSEATRHDGTPIHRALVRRLRQSRTASGATVLRGIWGFRDGQKPHGDKVFELSRRVPVTTIIVDSPDRIARSFDIVDELTSQHGLVTSEMVPALVAIDGDNRRGGTQLATYRY